MPNRLNLGKTHWPRSYKIVVGTFLNVEKLREENSSVVSYTPEYDI